MAVRGRKDVVDFIFFKWAEGGLFVELLMDMKNKYYYLLTGVMLWQVANGIDVRPLERSQSL